MYTNTSTSTSITTSGIQVIISDHNTNVQLSKKCNTVIRRYLHNTIYFKYSNYLDSAISPAFVRRCSL